MCSSDSGSDHDDDDEAICQGDGVDVRREPETPVAEHQGRPETQKTETQEDGTFVDSETSADDAQVAETKEGETKEDGDTKEVESMQGEANIALDAEDQSRARRMMPSPWPYDLAARRQARIDLEQEERNA